MSIQAFVSVSAINSKEMKKAIILLSVICLSLAGCKYDDYEPYINDKEQLVADIAERVLEIAVQNPAERLVTAYVEDSTKAREGISYLIGSMSGDCQVKVDYVGDDVWKVTNSNDDFSMTISRDSLTHVWTCSDIRARYVETEDGVDYTVALSAEGDTEFEWYVETSYSGYIRYSLLMSGVFNMTLNRSGDPDTYLCRILYDNGNSVCTVKLNNN